MKLSLRTWILAGVVAAIALAVFGFCERRAGKQEGAVNQEIKASAVVVKARKADAAIEVKKSVTKRAEYNAARAKVEVKGDTVVADRQSAVMPSVAALVKVADARGSQDSTSIAKQDLLVGALSDHVDLLQQEKKPRIGFKTGVALGVVATGVVVYVAVKIIKAVGHK